MEIIKISSSDDIISEKILKSYFHINNIDPAKMRNYWNWKYTQNPLGESHGYAAIDKQGRVVSLRMLWKRPTLATLQRSDVFQVGDTFTLPEYRKRGIGSRVLRALVEDNNNLSLYNFPNRTSSRIFDKYGWHHEKQFKIKFMLGTFFPDIRKVDPEGVIIDLSKRFNTNPKVLRWLFKDSNKNYSFWRVKDEILITKQQKGMNVTMYSTGVGKIGFKWVEAPPMKSNTLVVPDILVYKRTKDQLDISPLDVDYL